MTWRLSATPRQSSMRRHGRRYSAPARIVGEGSAETPGAPVTSAATCARASTLATTWGAPTGRPAARRRSRSGMPHEHRRWPQVSLLQHMRRLAVLLSLQAAKTTTGALRKMRTRGPWIATTCSWELTPRLTSGQARHRLTTRVSDVPSAGGLTEGRRSYG